MGVERPTHRRIRHHRRAAQHDRWTTLITTSGLTTDQAQAVIDSDAFGALTAKLRRAEANPYIVDTLHRASSGLVGSPTPTTSPPSSTTASPTPPPAPPDRDVPVTRRVSSPG